MKTEIIRINTDVPSKEDVKQIAARIAEEVIFGNVDPIEAHLKLSIIKDVAEDSLKQIRSSVNDKFDKWGSDKPVIAGWTVERVNGGNVAKFDHNPEWLKLKAQLAELEEKMKAAAKGMTIVDDVTGEVIPAAIMQPKEDSIRKSFKSKP